MTWMPDLFALARTWWRDFAVALAFLTRAPLLVRDSQGAGRDLARALRLAPLVGVLLGLLVGAVFWVARELGLTPGLAGLLAVAAGVWATGALHEDGLADTADGFGGGFETTAAAAPSACWPSSSRSPCAPAPWRRSPSRPWPPRP
jgi:cobalamin synthase